MDCNPIRVAEHNAQLSSRSAATALNLAILPVFSTVSSHNRSLQLLEPSQPWRKQTRSPWCRSSHPMASVMPKCSQTQGPTGEHILAHLNKHRNNLLPSEFTVHVANGQKMNFIGKMCIQFRLADNKHKEGMYIFPKLSGVILSWKAAKALRILPQHYLPLVFPWKQASKSPPQLTHHQPWMT